jgi:hypothetical protein
MGSSADEPMPRFVRRSDTRSVCMFCYQAVRVLAGHSLELEEKLHLATCPESPENKRLY